MKTLLLILALMMAGCGSDSHTSPPSNSGLCNTCIVSYPNNAPSIPYFILWNTNDGSVLPCDETTPFPEGVSCVNSGYNCTSPEYTLSNSDFYCQ